MEKCYLKEEEIESEKSEEPTEQREEDLKETEAAEATEEVDEETEELFEEEVEEKPEPSARREREEEFVEERIYTIPLRRAWDMPPKKRAPKAIRIIRAFIKRHMKVGESAIEEDEEEGGRIIIDEEVNEKIWRRGIEKPPRRLRIRAAKDEDGNVTVFLA